MPALSATVFVMSLLQQPHVPQRDYAAQTLVVRSEEAVAIQTATAAMLEYLKKHPKAGPLSRYYLRVEFRAPAVWEVSWELNDISARDGAIVFYLDTTGTKVTSIKDRQ